MVLGLVVCFVLSFGWRAVIWLCLSVDLCFGGVVDLNDLLNSVECIVVCCVLLACFGVCFICVSLCCMLCDSATCFVGDLHCCVFGCRGASICF